MSLRLERTRESHEIHDKNPRIRAIRGQKMTPLPRYLGGYASCVDSCSHPARAMEGRSFSFGSGTKKMYH